VFDRITEEKIIEAIKNGEFENLPGFGKPIVWDDPNPYENEWALAYELLKKNNITLPWIEKRKEIEAGLSAAISNCQSNLKISQDLALRQFFNEISALNRKIFDYNLSVPVSRLQRGQINIEELFSKIKNSK